MKNTPLGPLTFGERYQIQRNLLLLFVLVLLIVLACSIKEISRHRPVSAPETIQPNAPTLAEAIKPFLLSAPMPATGFGIRVRYVIEDLVQFSGAGIWWHGTDTIRPVNITKPYQGIVHAEVVDQLGDNIGQRMEYYIANVDTLHLYLVRYDHALNRFEIMPIKMRWITL